MGSQKKKTNKSGKIQKDYQKITAAAYLFLVMAVLPLYMQNGLTLIGEVKYVFFRNVSIAFLLLSLLVLLVNGGGKVGRRYSHADKCVICFGLVSILSSVFSSYQGIALWGFSGWHMGVVTQLLMIWGYFLISRWYVSERWVECGILLSAFLVSLLGVLNRYGLDPLGVFTNLDWFDWNRRNLLSTVGNINWYCSYLCVAVPLLVASYWGWNKGFVGRVLTGLGALAGIAALMLQGSDSGYVVLFILYIVLLMGSLGNREKELRFLELLCMLPIVCLTVSYQTKYVGMDILLPEGSSVKDVAASAVWLPFLLTVLLFWGILRYCIHRGLSRHYESGRIKKILLLTGGLALLGVVLLFVGCQISEEFWQKTGAIPWLRFDDRWGGERGFLWRKTFQVFWESSPIRKLFGAGPDCFAEYMDQSRDLAILVSGQWQDAIYANAHNEWLTMLINEGIFGVSAYIGFFLCAFFRFYSENERQQEKSPVLMAGTLALAVYGVNNCFSFQQVVSTPLIFLVAGMCEAYCRRETQNSILK